MVVVNCALLGLKPELRAIDKNDRFEYKGKAKQKEGVKN